jgi:hypothetical protein
MAYFALSIFLSAFLLFQVQPMVARNILPWFGGSSAVWSTVQMFFQVLLTGGYAYANWLTGRKKNRAIIHLVMLGLSLTLLLLFSFIWKSPITPGASWKPLPDQAPIWQICKLLLVAVGLPYFLLSTNSPLMQAWFSRTFPQKSAYRLYALSNAGSLLGLVTYPVLIEPYLTLAWQGRLWSLLYILYAGLAVFGAIKSLRSYPREAIDQSVAESHLDKKPSARDVSLWIVLAAAASILLLATTSHITQDIAVIPFLWILPLTIYLITFILAFSSERWYSRQFFLVLFFIMTLLYAWVMNQAGSLNITFQVGIFIALLFVACMICHGELYRLRPGSGHLTLFYLVVSIGGALGGILINFLAPVLFKGYWELPLGYVFCWVLFLVVSVSDKKVISQRRIVSIGNTVLLFSAVLISGVRAVQFIKADFTDGVGSWRNFYGVVRVRQMGIIGSETSAYSLIHGVTIHGIQFLSPVYRNNPSAYYGSVSGVGLAILNSPHYGKGMHVGVLGLGIGTLASYGQAGDTYRFYEINPEVIRLAKGDGGYFSYLGDSKASIDIIPGDARLSLEKELALGQLQNYDVLVLDVFSSDSIPVHLLDTEAFDLYLKHLSPNGILAVNITNSYLDLIPVVWKLADHDGLSRVLIEDPGHSFMEYPSIWVLLTRNPAILDIPPIISHATPMSTYVSRVDLWTDDFSNLFQILRH